MPSPEQIARQLIDELLTRAGWLVQDRSAANIFTARGVAIREFPLLPGFGFADYLIYVDARAAGTLEAKGRAATLTGVEPQSARYAQDLPPELPAWTRPLPFRYESTGVETHFTNGLDPEPRARPVFAFHRPETLASWLSDVQVQRTQVAADGLPPPRPNPSTFLHRVRAMPELVTEWGDHKLWPAQITAIRNLEKSLARQQLQVRRGVHRPAPRQQQPDTTARWRSAQIGDVARVISGLTKNPKRETLAHKLPYLRVANVYANELRLDAVERIGVADSEVEKLLLRHGDRLVVEGNGSPDQIGRVALWDGSIPDCVHQNHLIKVRFGSDVLSKWALTWLLSPRGQREIEQVSSSTSGLHTLSTGKVSRLPIPVPPVEDQRGIVAEVDRRLSSVREVEAEVDANLKRPGALRHGPEPDVFR